MDKGEPPLPKRSKYLQIALRPGSSGAEGLPLLQTGGMGQSLALSLALSLARSSRDLSGLSMDVSGLSRELGWACTFSRGQSSALQSSACSASPALCCPQSFAEVPDFIRVQNQGARAAAAAAQAARVKLK